MFINLASQRLEIVQLIRIESIEMSRSNKSDDNNRECRELRRRKQRQGQKTGGFISKTTALHVHRAFQYISLTSTARLRLETS